MALQKRSIFQNVRLIVLKGVTGYERWLNRICSVVENFFRIHLRHIKLFKDLYILSLSANSTFKTPTLGVDRFSESVLFILLNNEFWTLLLRLKLRIYRSLKSFMSQMNPKEAISFKDKNRMFVNSFFFDFLFMLPKVNNFFY